MYIYIYIYIYICICTSSLQRAKRPKRGSQVPESRPSGGQDKRLLYVKRAANATIVIHVAMNIGYGKLVHFCDAPISQEGLSPLFQIQTPKADRVTQRPAVESDSLQS